MPYTKKDANGNTIKDASGEPVRDLDKDKPLNKKNTGDRSLRNQARQDAIKEGLVAVGDKKEIDHQTPLSKGGGNGNGNLRVVSQETNRKKYNKQA